MLGRCRVCCRLARRAEQFPEDQSSIAIEGSATYDLKSESDHHVNEHRVLLADHPADQDVQDTPDHQTAEKSRADVSAIVTSTSYLHDVGDGPASDRKLDSDVDECQKAAQVDEGRLDYELHLFPGAVRYGYFVAIFRLRRIELT
jgi:hypothetical protein